MPLRCESGRLACFEPVVGQCEYCERHFCPKHGVVETKTCRRSPCQREFRRDTLAEEALKADEERRQIAEARNLDGKCGVVNCLNDLYKECHRCNRSFCPDHVNKLSYSYSYRTRRGTTRLFNEVHLCDTCKPYLYKYKRDRFG